MPGRIGPQHAVRSDFISSEVVFGMRYAASDPGLTTDL
jgi:hypothetical protein